MREQVERLKQTLQGEGSKEAAFKEVLCSELNRVFRQFMDVDSINIEIKSDKCIAVTVSGGGLKNVGFYCPG